MYADKLCLLAFPDTVRIINRSLLDLVGNEIYCKLCAQSLKCVQCLYLLLHRLAKCSDLLRYCVTNCKNADITNITGLRATKNVFLFVKLNKIQ